MKNQETKFTINKEEFLKKVVDTSNNNPVADLLLGFNILGNNTLEACGWNKETENMEFKISINGIELDALTFNKVFESWWDRQEKVIKENYDYLKTEEALQDKAEKLVKGRMSDVLDKLQDLDNDLGYLLEKRYN